jgi:TolA-binding protein
VIPQPDDWDANECEALEEFREELDELRDRHKADPPFEILRAARAGVLPEELQKAVNRHLELNAWSRAVIDGAETSEPLLGQQTCVDLLARIQQVISKDEQRHSPPFKLVRPALAAAAVLMMAAFLLLWRLGFRPISTNIPHAAPISATLSAAPAPVSPSPVFRLDLEKPGIKFNVAGLTFRGSSTNFLKDIAPAIEAYREGRYTQADRSFAALIPRYPKSTEVYFYMGVSRLLTSDASGAIQAFEAARKLDDALFASDVSWYLAIALERANHLEAARAELESLCIGKSPYAARACMAIK